MYIVLMHRFGDPERHTYALDKVWDDIEKARLEGVEEGYYRGGKYDYEIVEVTPA